MLIKEDKNMPTGVNVNNDNSNAVTQYFTKDELMETLRENIRNSENMQEMIREDMQMISSFHGQEFQLYNDRPSRAEFKRLGIETSNESLCQDNQTDYENAEKEAAKYLPEGFTKNLDEAYTKIIAQEKEAQKSSRPRENGL